ncbi:Cell division control protein 48 (nucleomorph) [Cryptomonas paramecium]|uniref:Cell division control protein 48 n=1 Tax=Cryptomonas paramaecium TaxID=2898 RepID=F2HID9_9CRYP|nr:Cell division control protein 48 [Cryptomonas paramecium]AEA39063.1 Cell division control protein 48 [Cryptomonas paramecium]|mmetsp:Transcript_16866/g.46105  ORF Transcript_16866/g.46105 Transcript_16866/m.46105 type:complete len:659 (+) Transcript_16866:2266-4242(+)
MKNPCTDKITLVFLQLKIFCYLPDTANSIDITLFSEICTNFFCFHFNILDFIFVKKRLQYFFRRFFRFNPEDKYIFTRKNFNSTRDVDVKNCLTVKCQISKKYKFFLFDNAVINSRLKYTDFIGIERLMVQIQKYIEWPLFVYKTHRRSDIYPVENILLLGQQGIGKTFLAYTIGGELKVPIFKLSLFFLLKTKIDKTKIKQFFKHLKQSPVHIFFIDNINKMENLSNHRKRKIKYKKFKKILAWITLYKKRKTNLSFLIATLDQMKSQCHVFPIENYFENKITINLPNLYHRFSLLFHFTKHIYLSKKINLNHISIKTKGFSPKDLFVLIKNTFILTLFRICKKVFKGKYRKKKINLINFKIKLIDLTFGFSKTKPSVQIKSLGKTEISWDQIGALHNVRTILSKYIIEPIKNSTHTLGKSAGVLLYGPPGCGKTLIAQAAACESNANYINIKGPEILDKFLGESEKTIRTIFNQARMYAPSVIFFDEIDSITFKRSSTTSSQNGVTDRILNQLLVEMDGIDKKEFIYVIGATNRPEVIDKAVLRPGRLDKFLFISFPRKKEKIQILNAICKKILILPYINFTYIIQFLPQKYSGADLTFLTKEAVLNNLNSRLDYTLIHNKINGLFNVSLFFINTQDYRMGFMKINKTNFIRLTAN